MTNNPNPASLPDPATAAAIPEFTLGDRLRKAREFADLEMGALADTIDIHRQSVARYEQGIAKPKRHVIMSWAFATGVSMEWIVGGDVMSTHVDKSEGTTDSSFAADYSSVSHGNTRILAQNRGRK